jgi:molybdenum cofactor biosynthesis protein B
LRPHEKHRKEAKGRLRVRIVTVSTSRYESRKGGEELPDEGGETAESEARRAGHFVTGRDLVSDDAPMLRGEVKKFLSGKDDVLLLTGGTGVSSRDVTIESVRPFFEKELVGFGELLRRISYDEIGSAAMLTRATAGVAKGKLLVCLPGSPGGVRTALRATMADFPHILLVARN